MQLHLKFSSKKRGTSEPAPDSPVAVAEPPVAEPTRRTIPIPAAVPRGGPRIKTYVSANVGQAMAAARRELGDEAILIQTKRLEPSDDPSRQYEITFGVIDGAPAAPIVATAPRIVEEAVPAPDAPAAGNSSEWTRELGSLRRDISALQSTLARHSWNNGSAPQGVRQAGRIYTMLTHQGVDPNLASDIALVLEETMVQGEETDAERSTALLASYLGSRIRTDSSLGWDQSTGKAVLLAGPPAGGKTTAIMKLALEYGVKRARPVEIFWLDRERPEPNRTLEGMASMLNIPFRPFSSAGALTAALRSRSAENSLVLIDTSGYGSGSIDLDRDLAELLQTGEAVDVHLVLSAAWHPAAIRRAVDRFEIFQPSRLLFTMLDQAAVFGPILQEAWRTSKPLSFFNNGGLGMGDIQPASLESVLRSMEEPAGSESSQ
jgi:flagellar biosynthesis protein FlhF